MRVSSSSRLPVELRPVLQEARRAYLGHEKDRLAMRPDQLTKFVHLVKHEASRLLDASINSV
ncbi:aminoglycoside adenylyltransferase domain-containing protein [Luteimonas suaedae]|uniref:aminoglycoside adenylyltransferase domain-containing protein n=1 Tax=Luteimonas suaedae TaxID=2605430 RepID=UPI003CCCCE82